MPKDIPQPVHSPTGKADLVADKVNKTNLPLSGGKKVKNKNHSRQNHGEGS